MEHILKLCVLLIALKSFYESNNLDSILSNPGIITGKKPYKGASIDTIRGRVKDILTANVIDFSPQRCWAGSTSKVKTINVDLGEIISHGRWKSRKKCFRFYDKEITKFPYSRNEFT